MLTAEKCERVAKKAKKQIWGTMSGAKTMRKAKKAIQPRENLEKIKI